MDETVEDVRRIVRGEAGELSIGFTNSALCHPSLPDMLGQFRETWPDVGLTLTEGNSSQLLGALREDTVDVAFVRTSIPYVSDVVVELIVEEPMVVAVPRTHRLAKEAPAGGLKLAELEDEDFILYQSQYNNGLYKTIVDACLGAGFTPRIRQKGPQLLAALNLVAGAGHFTRAPVHAAASCGAGGLYPAVFAYGFDGAALSGVPLGPDDGAKLYFIHQARRIRQAYGAVAAE